MNAYMNECLRACRVAWIAVLLQAIQYVHKGTSQLFHESRMLNVMARAEVLGLVFFSYFLHSFACANATHYCPACNLAR